MTNRVILDTDGLRVSRAGVNVIGAANVDLLFNSDWAHLRRFGQGAFAVPANSTKTYSMGKTFTALPIVDIFLKYLPSGDSYGYLGDFGTSSDGGNYSSMVDVTSTSIIITNSFGNEITGFYDIWDFTV